MRIAKISLIILVFLSIPAFAKPKVLEQAKEQVKSAKDKAKEKLKSNKKKASKHVDKAKEEIARARKNHPSIENLHQHTMKSAAELDENGTDLALKELALEFEKQFLSLMFSYMTTDMREGKNFAESVWDSERLTSIISQGDRLGAIGEAIYQELVDNANFKKKKDE